MAENIPTQNAEEIDLGYLFERIKSLFKSILIGIVSIIQFFWKHKFRLIVILVVGLALHYLYSSFNKKVYSNEFLIKANFGSVEYLYSKVDYIDSKLKSNDTLFLKTVFGDNYERVREVNVEPVIDVYSLINKSEENKAAFELLFDEFGDFSFIEEDLNIREYPLHKIKVFIKGENNNDVISNNFYEFLASNPFYNELKKNLIENLHSQLLENKKIRAQIDSIVKEQNATFGFTPDENNSVNFSGSQDFRGLLNQKSNLLSIDLEIKDRIKSEDKVIKIVDTSFSVLSEELNFSKFLIPFVLVFVYCMFYFLKYISRKTINYIS